jgi:hypothetical protein
MCSVARWKVGDIPCAKPILNGNPDPRYAVGDLWLRRSLRRSDGCAIQPNPANDPNAPPQKFALVFSMADVVILGWRLDLIANNLRDNQLASVRARPQRFAQLEDNRPFMASIAITPVTKG